MTDVAHLRELANSMRFIGGQLVVHPFNFPAYKLRLEEASAALVQAATQIEMLQKQLEAAEKWREVARLTKGR